MKKIGLFCLSLFLASFLFAGTARVEAMTPSIDSISVYTNGGEKMTAAVKEGYLIIVYDSIAVNSNRITHIETIMAQPCPMGLISNVITTTTLILNVNPADDMISKKIIMTKGGVRSPAFIVNTYQHKQGIAPQTGLHCNNKRVRI